MSWYIDYIMNLVERSAQLPWRSVKQWSPLQLDALGLITLLGAEEVNQTVGTLQRRRYTEFLPLLGSHVIAGDRFRDGQAGFSIYNITDGIHTTELKGWFTRWLSAQKIRNATTVFTWRVDGPRPRHATEIQLIAPLLAFLMVAPLLAFTILMGDWYGVAGTTSIIISIFVRKVVLWNHRTGLNNEAAPEKEPKELPFTRQDLSEKPKRVDSFVRQLHRETSQPQPDSNVTMLITRSDGKMVTMYAPRSILGTFVRDVAIPHPRLYQAMQILGWMAFGVLMVSLGMSSLFTQIYTVALLILSTWAMCHDFAFDSGRMCVHHHNFEDLQDQYTTIPFTSRLSVTQFNPAARDKQNNNLDKRMNAYVRVEPTDKQEAMLKHWSMLPFEGVPWYDIYNTAKEDYKQRKAAELARLAAPGLQTPQAPSRRAKRSSVTRSSVSSPPATPVKQAGGNTSPRT